MSTIIVNNKVAYVINNETTFDSNFSLHNDHIIDTQTLVIFEPKKGRKSCVTYTSRLICLWDTRYSNSMVNEKDINCTKKILPSNVEYGTVAGKYCTTNDVNLSFFIPYFAIRNSILHIFHINSKHVNKVIDYGIIIIHDLMGQLDLISNFKYNAFKLYGDTVNMKYLAY